MSNEIVGLIAVASIIGYGMMVGLSYEFCRRTKIGAERDGDVMLQGLLAVSWPIALPAILVIYVMRRNAKPDDDIPSARIHR